MTMMYVVMGNDYPDSVFSTGKAAEAYAQKRMREPSNFRLNSKTPRVYWRSYEFEVDKKVQDNELS